MRSGLGAVGARLRVTNQFWGTFRRDGFAAALSGLKLQAGVRALRPGVAEVQCVLKRTAQDLQCLYGHLFDAYVAAEVCSQITSDDPARLRGLQVFLQHTRASTRLQITGQQFKYMKRCAEAPSGILIVKEGDVGVSIRYRSYQDLCQQLRTALMRAEAVRSGYVDVTVRMGGPGEGMKSRRALNTALRV